MSTSSDRDLTAQREGQRNPDHRRAELLLAEVEACRDGCRRRELREQAVVLTLDLVDSVARRYRGRGMEGDDLVQVGRMALVKAAHGYRCGQGSSFAAYAVPTIAGEIKRHFRDQGWLVRPPRRLQELRSEAAAEQEHLRHQLLREPTDAELARSLGISVDEVREVRTSSMAYEGVPLDALDAGGPGDTLRGGSFEEGLAAADALRSALETLTERELLIVRLRCVEEMTQSQIGAALGVSQMQVSRLLGAILERLHHAMEDQAEWTGAACELELEGA
jgi:RNA polymerase sigma-B factor